ncbi:hypothetical protein LTS18_008112 [Coniosporium uncinatum]|uniref:Uncharacterized protein n=1 Tax=Coniosporium uncinatum TaxID=93489 RepID=A0ACC3D1Y9_9PEZI|nr:hypothetical protein LTS18_008112 [Coniosporium uncinatum]
MVYLQFTVQDTGRGLTDDEKDVLFARFSQASPRTHIHYGGSGLGLFISRRLTEMQGGAIGFSSESKSGSTFSFYVTARRSRVAQPQEVQESPKSNDVQRLDNSPAKANGGPQRLDMTKAIRRRMTSESTEPDTTPTMHVLVVEDNLINQRVLAKQLRALGCVVEVANHGVEALEHLRHTTYCRHGTKELSVILMDWEMPVMDGLTCVRRIRELQEEGTIRGYIPVIAVTANVRTEQVTTAVEAGMDDVVSKPFRVPELCERMRSVIDRLSG